MGLEVRLVHAWEPAVASLAAWVQGLSLGPFDTADILVDSTQTGRMLTQALSLELPTGITAGLTITTPSAWTRRLAERHGAHEWSQWQSKALELAIWPEVEALANDPGQSVLRAHLDGAPGRAQSVARRLARLWRRYADECPEVLAAWLDGEDVVRGEEIPAISRWQPELLRRVGETTGIDPLASADELVEAVREEPLSVPTAVLGVDEVTALQRQLLLATANGTDVAVWDFPGGTGWASDLGPAIAVDEPLPPPPVRLHHSHGKLRQAEVLRDELTRLLAADPSLEPRDVLIVVDDPTSWSSVLRTVFGPTGDEAGQHPGRTLRLATTTERPRNLVADLLLRLLDLPDQRATASSMVDLLTLRPLATRWGLTDRERLVDIVVAAQIRWGLDGNHRRRLGLGSIRQNTWQRGLDRLLAGIAMPAGDPSLGVTGVDTVSTSDLPLIGSLCEVISRIRRFVGVCESDASPVEWVDRCREVLSDLVGTDFTDQWMDLDTAHSLTAVADSLAGSHLSLSRAQFARLVSDLGQDSPLRPVAGNGAMQVVRVGELSHVAFPVVCLLGVGDVSSGTHPDDLLHDQLRTGRERRARHLRSHADSASVLVVVTQSADGQGQPVPLPQSLSALLADVGSLPEEFHHPITAQSRDNFILGSYDTRAHGFASGLREEPRLPPAHVARRRAATALSVPDAAFTGSPADLAAFLKDPAKTFLRSAAGVRLLRATEVSDVIPLEHDALSGWGVRHRLLHASLSGVGAERAMLAEREREAVAPDGIGKALVTADANTIGDLRRMAQSRWDKPLEEYALSVELGGNQVTGVVQRRGESIVAMGASGGEATLVEPWIDLLMLRAAGIECDGAYVYGIITKFAKQECVCTRLAAPDPDSARRILGGIVEAARQGRHRLVPLPLGPALTLASSIVTGTFDISVWSSPSSIWDDPWRRRGDEWRLFFRGPSSELFDDPAGPADPQPPDARWDGLGTFGSWTSATVLPLAAARGDLR